MLNTDDFDLLINEKEEECGAFELREGNENKLSRVE